jgi:Undecaprenyl-phosphate galactose phosphotransferase WbaP
MESNLTSSTAFALSTEYIPTSVSVSRPVGTLACLMSTDILSIVGSLLLASNLRDHLWPMPGNPIAGTILPALLIVLGSFVVVGLYPGVSLNPVEELRLSTLSITVAFLVLWSATFFLHDLSLSRFVYLAAYFFAVLSVPLFRFVARQAFCRQSWWGSQVVILGYGATGKLILDKLNNNPRLGLKPYAVLDDDLAKTEHIEGDLLRGPLSRCLQITADHKISYGIVCMPSLSRQELLTLLDRYGQCFGHVLVIPNLIGMTSLGITAKEVSGIIGLELKQQLLRPSSRCLKRLLDIAISLVAAPIVLPLVAVFALLIKTADAGPAFYANPRLGVGGRKFKAWKLRSMLLDGESVLRQYLNDNPVEHAQWRATQKLKRDPRLTRVGRFIRQTSIDELPQFWNVLRGEMSVVGPRPILEHQVSMYGPGFNLYKQVRPGITGLWQVSGRNHLSFAERANLDKYVIQNWSVWLDVYILARTLSVLITRNGAY